jgi:hypothetical protein
MGTMSGIDEIDLLGFIAADNLKLTGNALIADVCAGPAPIRYRYCRGF